MEHEKSFKKIRRAVDATAEQLAEQEMSDKPQEKHYKEVFRIMREAKKYSMELFENFLKVAIERKELKELFGEKRFILFQNVCKEITENIIGGDEIQISAPPEDHENLLKSIFSKLQNGIKNDPRIISEFNGGEDLIDKGIDYIKTEFSLIEARNKNQ